MANIYVGKYLWDEEKIGRIDGVPRRAGCAALLLLLR